MSTTSTESSPLSVSESDVQSWLVTHLSETLSLPPEELEVDRSLFDLGLDSAAAVGLTDELSEWLSRPVDPSLLYDYPTIKQLAGNLAQPSGESQ